MFIVKKLFTPFLLPPGIFIILIMLSGVWLLLRKNRKAGIVNITIAFLMWLLTISPVSNGMLWSLESKFSIPENPKGDVIILLGGGVYDKVPDLSGNGTPSETMLSRILTAVRLHNRMQIPIIVSTGKVYKHKAAEAPIVKRFLVDLGIPANEIIIEDKSRDTLENAKFTKDICLESGFSKPILVTSAYHMKRAFMLFERAGLGVLPFPAGFRSFDDRQYGWNDYLPGGFGEASRAIKEYLGLLFYRFAY